MKKSNPARKRRKFLQAYGSTARVAWVQEQPCITCGTRPSENAHIETGGIGLKAHYTKIVPLCKQHHRQLHEIGRKSFESGWKLDLATWAARTQGAWLRSQEKETFVWGKV